MSPPPARAAHCGREAALEASPPRGRALGAPGSAAALELLGSPGDEARRRAVEELAKAQADERQKLCVFEAPGASPRRDALARAELGSREAALEASPPRGRARGTAAAPDVARSPGDEARWRAVEELTRAQADERQKLCVFEAPGASPGSDAARLVQLVPSPARPRAVPWQESLRSPCAGQGAARWSPVLTVPEGPRLRTASRSLSRSSSRAASAERLLSGQLEERRGRGASRERGAGLPPSRSTASLTVPQGPVLSTHLRSLSRSCRSLSCEVRGLIRGSRSCSSLPPERSHEAAAPTTASARGRARAHSRAPASPRARSRAEAPALGGSLAQQSGLAARRLLDDFGEADAVVAAEQATEGGVVAPEPEPVARFGCSAEDPPGDSAVPCAESPRARGGRQSTGSCYSFCDSADEPSAAAAAAAAPEPPAAAAAASEPGAAADEAPARAAAAPEASTDAPSELSMFLPAAPARREPARAEAELARSQALHALARAQESQRERLCVFKR